MLTSQNGFPANDINQTTVWTIPGTTRRIRLAKGNPGLILVDFAAWFDKAIENIDPEHAQLDDWGYAERTIRGSSTTLSNHASGTAMDLNAVRHPMGVRGTFTAEQATRIRARLAQYDGAIRWGGDYTSRPDEMHFEINTSAAHVAEVAQRIRDGRIGTEEDPMPTADEIADANWNRELPVYDGKKGETRRAQVIVAQTHNRAGDARSAARACVEGLRDLAQLVGDRTLSDAERTVLANEIAERTAKEVERLDAAAVAEHLEVRPKEKA
jgi:hypothetical protein